MPEYRLGLSENHIGGRLAQSLTLFDGRASTTALIRYLWSARAIIGISRLSDLTPLDCLGISVVAAIRPSAKTGQITTCQGKGVRIGAAVVGALMEAVERFSCSAYSSIDKVAQSRLAAEIAEKKAESDLVEAVWGVSLISGSRYAVRASSVLFPYSKWSPDSPWPRPNTSGLASGVTPEYALQSALLELVERDAVSRFFEGEGGSAVDLSEISDPIVRRLLDTFQQKGVELLIARLVPLGRIQTVKVFALDTRSRQPHLAVTGQASDLDLDAATCKALLEVAQARATAIQASREDLRRYRATWQAQYGELRETFEFLRHRLATAKRISAYNPTTSGRNASLDSTLRELSQAGCSEVIAVDLTHHEVGIPVFRVLVPGLADTLAGGRRIPRDVP